MTGGIKKILKLCTDILMYADFIFLMLHGTVRNLTVHGIFGIILFALFIFHHILNVWFYKLAFTGRWDVKRVVLNLTDWLLFVFMVLMAVSSVMISGFVFEWSPVHAMQIWRTIHHVSTSWGFMIMNIHLALHIRPILIRFTAKIDRKWLKAAFYVLLFMLAAAGIFCFYKTRLYIYMFNTGGWKPAAADVFIGILEYVGMTAGICSISGL